MKQFNLTIDETELATMICSLRGDASSYTKSLVAECAKPQPDEDELLFLTTEYSKVNFLLRKLETINELNQLGI